MQSKRRKPKSLAKSDHWVQHPEDLIKRDFSATEPFQKLLTGITETTCKGGKLYLCAVLDCYDAAVIAFSMGNKMKTPLCTAAITPAIKRYGKAENIILHSDRGSQFTSNLFRESLAVQGIHQSMGHTGSCYDNARMQSFFATFKKDLVYRFRFSRDGVKRHIFEWIESYYNRVRRHSSN